MKKTPLVTSSILLLILFFFKKSIKHNQSLKSDVDLLNFEKNLLVEKAATWENSYIDIVESITQINKKWAK